MSPAQGFIVTHNTAYYFNFTGQSSKLNLTLPFQLKVNKNNSLNNTGWLQGIRAPSKQQQQPAPQKQQQHPFLGMHATTTPSPSLSSLTAQGTVTVNINRVIKIAQTYK